jgi:hypothetical protein
MNAVFADSFCWIAITNLQDLAHERAKALTLSPTPGALCTTEEVLTEYLNYFAAWGPNFRHKAAINVQNVLENRTVEVVPQTAASFATGLNLTARVWTRVTA